MKKLLLFPLFVLALSALAYVTPNWKKPSTTLAWDYPTNTPIAGFRLYWGVEPRGYTNFMNCPSIGRQLTVPGLVNNTTYYFSATAYDVDGLESDYSNEVTNTTPVKPTPPGQLRNVLIPPAN